MIIFWSSNHALILWLFLSLDPPLINRLVFNHLIFPLSFDPILIFRSSSNPPILPTVIIWLFSDNLILWSYDPNSDHPIFSPFFPSFLSSVFLLIILSFPHRMIIFLSSIFFFYHLIISSLIDLRIILWSPPDSLIDLKYNLSEIIHGIKFNPHSGPLFNGPTWTNIPLFSSTQSNPMFMQDINV